MWGEKKDKNECDNSVACVSLWIRVDRSDVVWEDRGNAAVWEHLGMGK